MLIHSLGKSILSLFIFCAVFMLSLSASLFLIDRFFLPEQTIFPKDIPPMDFMVVIENSKETHLDKKFGITTYKNIPKVVAEHKDFTFRLSMKEYHRDGDGLTKFKVIEETPDYQVVDVTFDGTAFIKTRYRVEGDKITPLSYKIIGNIGMGHIYIILLIVCLWFSNLLKRIFMQRFFPDDEII